MPAESKSQRRLFGMVEAEKKHKFHTKNQALQEKIRNIAKGISTESASHFSRTPEAGLPEKVSSTRWAKELPRLTEQAIGKLRGDERWIQPPSVIPKDHVLKTEIRRNLGHTHDPLDRSQHVRDSVHPSVHRLLNKTIGHDNLAQEVNKPNSLIARQYEVLHGDEGEIYLAGKKNHPRWSSEKQGYTIEEKLQRLWQRRDPELREADNPFGKGAGKPWVEPPWHKTAARGDLIKKFFKHGPPGKIAPRHTIEASSQAHAMKELRRIRTSYPPTVIPHVKQAARGDFAKKFISDLYNAPFPRTRLDKLEGHSSIHGPHSISPNLRQDVHDAKRVTLGHGRFGISKSKEDSWHQKHVADTIKAVRSIDRSKEASFVEGFLKAAEVYGATPEQVRDLAKYAALQKVSNPLLAAGIRALGPAVGMLGLPHLFEMGAARAAAGVAQRAGGQAVAGTAAKTLPSWLQGGAIEKGLAGFADTTKEAIPAGGVITREPSWKKSLGSGALSLAGMPLGGMAVEPLAQHFDQPDQNSLPQEAPPQYNEGQFEPQFDQQYGYN